MKLNRLLGSLLFAAVTLTQAQEVAIVGGITAEEEEFPWMVQLLVNNVHYCGGSLIAPQWVLTAGHCAVDSPTLGLIPPDKAIINSIHLNMVESYSEEVNIESVFNYPTFDIDLFDQGNDLTLLKLETPITSITPVAIHNINNDAVQLNDSLLVMGWGAINDMGTGSSTLLYSYPTAKDITDKLIYAGYDSTETVAGAGAGDSGGPLLKTINGILTQVGIVSGGIGVITDDGSPGFYTRVYKYANWIDSVITAESAEPVNIQEWSSLLNVNLSSGILTLKSSETLTNPLPFNLIDLKGSTIYSNTMYSNSTFDVSTISTGIYIFQARNNNQVYNQKLIKL